MYIWIQGCWIRRAMGARVAAVLSSAISTKLAAPGETQSGIDGCSCVMARIVPSRSA